MLKNPKRFRSRWDSVVYAEFYAGSVWFCFTDDEVVYTMSEELFRRLFKE